jgi:hypothetical protein
MVLSLNKVYVIENIEEEGGMYRQFVQKDPLLSCLGWSVVKIEKYNAAGK